MGKFSRRNFLKYSTLGMVGAGIRNQGIPLKSEEKIQSESPKIKEYRTLGRTGFKVSDISLGGPMNPAVLNALLDAGVNYIDTSESYGRGQSERVIGDVIKNRDRKSVFISTKLLLRSLFSMKISKEDISKEGVLRRARQCLERLQTDYIDCLMVSNAENVDILKSEGFHAAAKQLKSEGRLRFVGVSHHGSQWIVSPEESMEKVLLAAAEDGRFDVVLLAYNFLKQDMGEKILKVCKEKNIGTTLMKSNPVGQYYGLKQWAERQEREGKKVGESERKMLNRLKKKADLAEGFIKKHSLENPAEIKDAAIRFCLSNPHVNTVLVTFQNFNDVKEHIKLSGTRLTPVDKRNLSGYSQSCGSLYCRHACGLCEPHCPHNVPVNTIMRYNHYFESQGREKLALEKYAELATPKADLCQTCEGTCEAACPYGVPIHGLLVRAHQNLTLA